MISGMATLIPRGEEQRGERDFQQRGDDQAASECGRGAILVEGGLRIELRSHGAGIGRDEHRPASDPLHARGGVRLVVRPVPDGHPAGLAVEGDAAPEAALAGERERVIGRSFPPAVGAGAQDRLFDPAQAGRALNVQTGSLTASPVGGIALGGARFPRQHAEAQAQERDPQHQFNAYRTAGYLPLIQRRSGGTVRKAKPISVKPSGRQKNR